MDQFLLSHAVSMTHGSPASTSSVVINALRLSGPGFSVVLVSRVFCLRPVSVSLTPVSRLSRVLVSGFLFSSVVFVDLVLDSFWTCLAVQLVGLL